VVMHQRRALRSEPLYVRRLGAEGGRKRGQQHDPSGPLASRRPFKAAVAARLMSHNPLVGIRRPTAGRSPPGTGSRRRLGSSCGSSKATGCGRCGRSCSGKGCASASWSDCGGPTSISRRGSSGSSSSPRHWATRSRLPRARAETPSGRSRSTTASSGRCASNANSRRPNASTSEPTRRATWCSPVPTSYVDELRGGCCPGASGTQPSNSPLVVDATQAADQFGLRQAQFPGL
jgi:hypothetical protein